jgi:hypothetical protein
MTNYRIKLIEAGLLFPANTHIAQRNNDIVMVEKDTVTEAEYSIPAGFHLIVKPNIFWYSYLSPGERVKLYNEGKITI